MSLIYPQYRALKGSNTLYRIDGPLHFLEWQGLGEDRWLAHAHYAEIYPTRVLLQELLEAKDSFEKLHAEEWNERFEKRETNALSGSISQVRVSSDSQTIRNSVDLTDWTTFGVPALAKDWMSATSDDEVRTALAYAEDRGLPLLIMGGGSNVLLHRDWPGLALHIGLKGFQVLRENGDEVDVVVGAGENWHDWVMVSLEMGWNGLENLALIPGNVGASPMQNIGAYGVEVKDRFLWLEAINIQTGALHRFDAAACEFDYRESIFKSAAKGHWVIVRVAFSLQRKAPLNTEYGSIQKELEGLPQETWTHRDVADAVMRIRSSKLPDPKKLGNAGSFFKNPILSAADFEALRVRHPEVAHFVQGDGNIKIAAGWLIERAGWKGKRRGTHGVHEKQALVLVHYGGASGKDIWKLAQDVMADVFEKFGVQLQTEVNQIGL